MSPVFDMVEVKAYERNDRGGEARVGFLANEVRDALEASGLPNTFTGWTPKGGEADGPDGPKLLTLDYARLAACTLWSVCKRQEEAIAALTSRVAALEAN